MLLLLLLTTMMMMMMMMTTTTTMMMMTMMMTMMMILIQVLGDVTETPGERRINSMFYDERREQLITGCNVIDVVPLSRAVHDVTRIPHTHDRPLAVVSHYVLFYMSQQCKNQNQEKKLI